MNRTELRQALDEAGFSPMDYRLPPDKPDDNTFCLERRGKVWLVYHLERGTRFELRRFNTEDAACEYFLRRFRGGPL